MSETPIGDSVMGPEVTGVDSPEIVEPGLVRGIAPHGVDNPDGYVIPEESEPDEAGEEATEGDDQVEATDNSGEPEAGDEPQAPDAVQDNGSELDGDEPIAP